METGVYVDVLLVINYVVNMLLITGTAKLAGRGPKRRRIVAAALLGALSSLTIFFPFMGFFASILSKLLISALIVRVAFSYRGFSTLLKEIFLFFAVSFFFAGVMLGLWMVLRPKGMLYYNGVVYFDISSVTLLVSTVAVYLLLTAFHKFSRSGRLPLAVYKTQIHLDGRAVTVRGLIDTGNALYEPFSDTPVIVCWLEDVADLLPAGLVERLRHRDYASSGGGGFPLRLIPYGNVGGGGLIPAFRADEVMVSGPGEHRRVESVYIGLSPNRVGGEGYNAVINPDLIGIKIQNGGVV